MTTAFRAFQFGPVVAVNVALLPIVAFGLAAGWGHVDLGAWLGTALAGATVVWHWRKSRVAALELTMLVTLAAIALYGTWGMPLRPRAAVSLGFVGLALGTGMSVLMLRPWTGDYSRAQYQGATKDPLFLRINTVLSGMWSLLFGWLAFASFEGLGPAASWVPAVAGSTTSLILPMLWVRRNLQRRVDAQEPYKWQPPDFAARRADVSSPVDFDVIVVGAGMGGLTAGALLAQSGLKVLVCEQYSAAGGFAHTWTRAGQDGDSKPEFRFDSGVHDVSGVWNGAPVYGILARLGLGNRIEFKRMHHRYVKDGEVFDVPPSWSGYVDAMAARYPADVVGIRGALADIHRIFESMYSLASQRSGIPGAPGTVQGLLDFAREHPLAVQWMNKPFAELLGAHIANAEARDDLSNLSSYITHSPTSLSVADMVPLFGYYIHGGSYPVGGSGVIAQALVDSITLDGGEVRLNTPVARVLAEQGVVSGVRLADRQSIHASAVVVNSDFLTAVRELVDTSQWPPAFQHAVDAMEPTGSAFGVHLGVRGDFAGVPPIIHVRHGEQRVGIVIPSNVDASAAPQGYSTVELLSLMTHEQAVTWFDDAHLTDNRQQRFSPIYAEKKRLLGDQLVQLAELALPGLRSRIVYSTEASPLTFRRYDWCQDGAIYGKTESAIPTKSPLPGLVFASAATHGAGIEAVVISGAHAAQALVPGLLQQKKAVVSDA